VTPAEALQAIRALAVKGRVRVKPHAYQRMQQRNVTFRDVSSALCRASTCEVNNDKWRVTGPDGDGDSLTCIVAVEDDVVVITVF
jgi:hypothetical protein